MFEVFAILPHRNHEDGADKSVLLTWLDRQTATNHPTHFYFYNRFKCYSK